MDYSITYVYNFMSSILNLKKVENRIVSKINLNLTYFYFIHFNNIIINIKIISFETLLYNNS